MSGGAGALLGNANASIIAAESRPVGDTVFVARAASRGVTESFFAIFSIAVSVVAVCMLVTDRRFFAVPDGVVRVAVLIEIEPVLATIPIANAALFIETEAAASRRRTALGTGPPTGALVVAALFTPGAVGRGVAVSNLTRDAHNASRGIGISIGVVAVAAIVGIVAIGVVVVPTEAIAIFATLVVEGEPATSGEGNNEER